MIAEHILLLLAGGRLTSPTSIADHGFSGFAT
jgi:hypothetical protein